MYDEISRSICSSSVPLTEPAISLSPSLRPFTTNQQLHHQQQMAHIRSSFYLSLKCGNWINFFLHFSTICISKLCKVKSKCAEYKNKCFLPTAAIAVATTASSREILRLRKNKNSSIWEHIFLRTYTGLFSI